MPLLILPSILKLDYSEFGITNLLVLIKYDLFILKIPHV